MLWLNLFIITSYYLVGNFALFFTTHIASSTPIGFSNGLSLALALIFGITQVFPGIIIGCCIAGFMTSAPPLTMAGLVAAKCFEVYLSSMLLVAGENGVFRFKRPKDIFYFICIAGALFPFVSSTISISFIYLGGMAENGHIPQIWLNYFMGTVLGVLIFTPLILSFFNEEKQLRKTSYPETILLFSTLALFTYWSSESHEARQYILIPLLTWVALRFSFRGVSIGALIVGTIFILRSSYFRGVYDINPEVNHLWIQCLIGGITIVGYFMATVEQAQLTASEREKELSINLKHKKIAEEALAILDQSIHKSPIGFALIDREYKFIRINEMLAKINGATPEYHLGKTMREVLPDIEEKMITMIDRVFTTGESLMNIPYQCSGSIGNGISAGLVSYYPIRHPATNEIFSVAVSFQDVTELLKTQRLLKENQDRLTFAQEAGGIGAFEWCLESNSIIWTEELENIYGLEAGEFGGLFESWLKCIHPDDVPTTKEEFFKVISGTQELNHQFRIITRNSEIRWILARGKVVRNSDDEIVKLIGINIDLTEQKNYEQKLRLTEANLLHALSVRDEFVAIASHELKTPLTSLKLQLQMFQRGIERKDSLIFTPEKINNLLDKNSRQIDRLTRLVDDMLDISRIRTGKLSLKKEACDLSSILRDILGRTREQFEVSGSGQPFIERFDQATGEWDPLRIEQVLTNIITNAIRYGQGKPISISVKNYQESVRITVSDQGLGIPKSDQKKIFERYERGLLRREVSGLGLGLFITHQIVEAHQGRIWVESELNQGATFFVDLPRLIQPVAYNPVDNLTEVES